MTSPVGAQRLDLELTPLPPPAAPPATGEGGVFQRLLANAQDPSAKLVSDDALLMIAVEELPEVATTDPLADQLAAALAATIPVPPATADIALPTFPPVAAEPELQGVSDTDIAPTLPVIEGPDGPIDFTELFPELFVDAPAATDSAVAIPEGVATSETLQTQSAPAAATITAPATPQAEFVRQFRYGFGNGKPSVNVAPVNAKHLDRFGRDVYKLHASTNDIQLPLATTPVFAQTPAPAATAPVTSLETPTAPALPSVPALPSAPVQPSPAPSVMFDGEAAPDIAPSQPATPQHTPVQNTTVQDMTVIEDTPQDEPDLPVLGIQVSVKTPTRPLATHLRADTSVFTPQVQASALTNPAAKLQPAQPEQPGAQQTSDATPNAQGAAPVASNAVQANGSSAQQQPSGFGGDQPQAKTTPAPPLQQSVVDALDLDISGLRPDAITADPLEAADAKSDATPAQRIAAQLAVRLDKTVVPEGTSRIRVVISPPELGQITIELTRQGDTLGTRVLTRTLEAHALLERILPELRQQLEDRGYLLKHLDVSYQGQGSMHGESRGHWQPPQTQGDWMLPPLPRNGVEPPAEDDQSRAVRTLEHGLNLTV